MLHRKQGSALVITILLTLVVMTMGIYTLAKIVPLSRNIQGLEQSMQARYHAKSGEEIAKLIYYSDLKESKKQRESADFGSFTDAEKQKAFCRTEGSILINNREKRLAVAQCIESKTQCSDTQCNNVDVDTAIEVCQDESLSTGNYKDFLSGGTTEESITYNCSERDVADANPISDPTGGVETNITSQTVRIPQMCQGDSDLSYSTDGTCQNWNKLTPGEPLRINISNMANLAFEDASALSASIRYSFAIRFRLPDMVKDDGDGANPEEALYLTVPEKDDPVVLWNLYDEEIAFFPAEAENAITRFIVFQENKDNNGQVDGSEEMTSGRSLGSSQYEGIWENTTECQTAKANGSLTETQVKDACSKTLLEFFTEELGNCEHRVCFLELQLVGDLSLAQDADNFGVLHPDGIKAPYLEYQILAGRAGGTASGEEVKITDTRPVITSVGESGGYSVKTETIIEEDALIPTTSSPIGR